MGRVVQIAELVEGYKDRLLVCPYTRICSLLSGARAGRYLGTPWWNTAPMFRNRNWLVVPSLWVGLDACSTGGWQVGWLSCGKGWLFGCLVPGLRPGCPAHGW